MLDASGEHGVGQCDSDVDDDRPLAGHLRGPASPTLTQSCEVGTAVGPNLQGKKTEAQDS